MAKKGKRGGGGSGGGHGARTAPSAMGGLVVVNPALLHSMATASKPQQAKKIDKNSGKKRGPSEPTDNKKSKKKRAIPKEDTTQVASNGPALENVQVLAMQREDQLLAGLYWLLLTRENPRSSVVALPNTHQTLSAPHVAGVFKVLGFQALAVHNKMANTQRKQSIDRLRSNPHDDKCVLITTEHFLASSTCAKADFLAVGLDMVRVNASASKFACTIALGTTTTASSTQTFEPSPSPAALQQLQARLKLATQIVTITQKLGQSHTEDADGKWAAKLAKGADLEDEEDDDTAHKKKKKATKKALSPDEQRLQALSEKLVVLLAKRIDATGSTSSKQQDASAKASDDAQHRTEKLKLLGITTMSAAVGSSVTDERLSAQTQWLDTAPGAQFGGDWKAEIRHGASKDATSLALREHYCSCRKKKLTSSTHLQRWRPNEQPADREQWGGAYGKVCGHNEVVMQHLRPFFPQEVLNSRVCSKRHPASGNQGFDGCLEFLRLACLDGRQALTVWDAEQFLFLTPDGRVLGVKKLPLLQLPLAGLQCLLQALRHWTLACRGQTSPNALLASIRLVCQLGNGDVTSPRFADAKVVKRVLAFAVGGSQRVWKQITRLSPLDTDELYHKET